MADISEATFASMIAHMNDDHPDAVVAYARHFGRMDPVESARIVAMDAHGITVEVASGTDMSVVSIPYDHELVDGDDGRDTLIAMYMQAAAVDNAVGHE
jgi:putative heme iron utilization protein